MIGKICKILEKFRKILGIILSKEDKIQEKNKKISLFPIYSCTPVKQAREEL